jgi:hypothetical protein
VPIASYGFIWTSSIAHHTEWTGAITSAAAACATTARQVGGTSVARRASQAMHGENTNHAFQISTW